MFARDAARLQRKAAKQRRQREEQKALASIKRPYEPTYPVDAQRLPTVVDVQNDRPRPFGAERYEWT